MLVQYSKIIDLPIVDLRAESKVGEVSEFIIQKTTLGVAGIVLKKQSLLSFSETKVITANDILELTKEAIIINEEDSIVPINEAIRLKDLFNHKFYGIYQRVLTRKGKNVGIVYDFIVDSTTLKITKLYCKTFFSDKIIPASSVIKIEGKKIYIKDDFDNTKLTTPAVENSLV